nr:hypothetical protein Iba_chr14bCG17010 [Ipomoea batatas]
MSLSSKTSSCIKLAVWIISMISASRLCSLVNSFRSQISAVARATRKTKAGLILFPPAPKICSAADIKTGFSAPTIDCKFLFRVRRSSATGPNIFASNTGLLGFSFKSNTGGEAGATAETRPPEVSVQNTRQWPISRRQHSSFRALKPLLTFPNTQLATFLTDCSSMAAFEQHPKSNLLLPNSRLW